MARKRGGLAGFWDREKKWLAPVSEGLVGMIPGVGPLAAAGLGAAIGGLDRPGQRGIGFDAGGAVKGGLTGYGMGQLGSMAKGGIQNLLTAGQSAAPAIAPSTPSTMPPAPSQISLTSNVGRATAPAFTPSSSTLSAPSSMQDLLTATPLSTPPTNVFGKIKSGLSAASDWADRNKTAVEGITKGVGMFLPTPQAQAQMAQAKIAEQQLAFQKQQYEDEQNRRRQMAQLLMPMYQQYMTQFGYNK